MHQQVESAPETSTAEAVPAPAGAPSRARSQRKGPPVPRLAVRVGVVGHRPNRLDHADLDALRARIRETLEMVQRISRDAHADGAAAYTSEAPLLTIVSALAEGAHRTVAEEGLGLGFHLQCVLPFERTEYERDFEQTGAILEHRRLLHHATAALELDGARHTPQRENESYESAGRMVLNHCEMLIAVWDGQETEGTDSTAQIVAIALDLGLPIIWINARAPHEVKLLLSDSTGRRRELALPQLVEPLRALLLPPTNLENGEHSHDSPDALLQAYYSERQPDFTPIGWAWGLFVGVLGDRKLRRPRIRIRDFISTTQAEWRRYWERSPSLPASVIEQLEQSMLLPYAWADNLAVRYVNTYRSSYLLGYVLGVIGVLFELSADTMSPAAGLARFVLQLLALGVLVSIVLIWGVGRRRRWHERWIDYRLLAELLRQVPFLSLLGQIPVFSRLPAHNAYDNPRNTWLNWYLRAQIRAAGIINVRFDPAYLEAVRVLLREGLLKDQSEYHQNSVALRLSRVDDMLKRAGFLTFGLTLLLLALLVAGSIARLVLSQGSAELLRQFAEYSDAGVLRLLAVWLPIAGGAIAAIRTQAELERLVKRSHAMSRQLAGLAETLLEQEPQLSSFGLAQVAESAAQAMISEVLDWRIVFQEKPLELSG